MPTESFPIAPTVLSVPLHSYGMLAYQLEISGLRSKRDCDLLKDGFAFAKRFEDGDLLHFFFISNFPDLKFETLNRRVEISNSEASVCGLSPVILSAQGCLTSELLRFL